MLTTSYEVKRKLEALSLLSYIKKYDGILDERKKTSNHKEKLIQKFGKRCAICNNEKNIEAAHIVPLELGSKTDEGNLILLCGAEHKLYDKGHCSISQMKEIGRLWRNKNEMPAYLFSENAEVIVTGGGYSLIRDVELLKSERKFSKAEELIRLGITRNNTVTTNDILLIKLAEVNRRRNKVNSIELAQAILTQIDPGRVPDEIRYYYYYEKQIIELLLGKHKESIRTAESYLEETFNFSKTKLPYVSARSIMLNCELALMPSSDLDVAYFDREYDKLLNVLASCDNYNQGRWNLSILEHRQHVYLKAKNKNKCLQNIKAINNCFELLDTKGGWGKSALQFVSFCNAATKVLFQGNNEKDVDDGLCLLARSFMTHLKSMQRFSGLRDIGLIFAEGLKHKNENKASEALRTVMHEVRDGYSLIYPYFSA